jgi:hypothetical protein
MGTELITHETMNHFTGSEGLHYSRFIPQVKYTDGVSFLDHNGAGWLVDAIKTHLVLTRKVAQEDFVCITLTVKNKTATLTFTDGNETKLASQKFEYTDFPLPEVKFFYTNKVLMLNTEY